MAAATEGCTSAALAIALLLRGGDGPDDDLIGRTTAEAAAADAGLELLLYELLLDDPLVSVVF